MKVAVIQMDSTADKNKNIATAVNLVKKAVRNKAKFILLPEVFHYRGPINSAKDLSSVKESIPGDSTAPLIALAKQYNVHILVGSIYEKVNRLKKVYNTSIMINSRGQIKARYRKINLFNARVGKKKIKEARYLLHGQKPATVTINKFKIGLSICYDVRFPKLYQQYAKAGVHVICVPSSFTRMTGEAHWESLLRARAIENLCYVLAPNQIGKSSDGVPSYGNSMIVGPWGKVLSRATPNKQGIIYGNLNLSYLKKQRRKLPDFNKGY